MKFHKRPNGEAIVIVPTDRNRSLGVFLVFLGVVAVLPLWYFLGMWTGHPPQNWFGWYPGLFTAGITVITGFLIGWHSHKTILINQTQVRVRDGFMRRALTFTWKGTPTVRVQHIEQKVGDQPQITWLVKLIDERAEYTVDERTSQQLESRWVAEGVAKTLLCPLVMKDEAGADVQIDARDLDLPFRERVQKYPTLLGHPAPQPTSVPIRKEVQPESTAFSWSMASAGPIFDLISVSVIFLVFSVLPPWRNHPSLLEVARVTHNYSVFIWTAAVISVALLVIIGFRTQLAIAKDFVRTTETLYGLPVRIHRIPLCEVEEVNVQHSMRGPVVFVISDRALMQFRFTDNLVAAWLAGEIRSCLVNVEC